MQHAGAPGRRPGPEASGGWGHGPGASTRESQRLLTLPMDHWAVMLAEGTAGLPRVSSALKHLGTVIHSSIQQMSEENAEC